MVTTRPFGTIKGNPVTAYTLENTAGYRLTVIDYGARIQSLILPDGRDAVLGYDGSAGYEADTAFLGAVCGRYANRISNASFVVNGVTCHIDANEGKNTLHGGKKGFSGCMYRGEAQDDALIFTLESPDGDMGFPGNLTLTVRYTLLDDGVRIQYRAESDMDTPVNVTNHSYFNLNGGNLIFDHKLRVNADLFLPTDDELLPTGEIRPVADTVFDLRTPVRLGDRLEPMDPSLAANKGFDNTLVLNKTERGTLEYAASLIAPDGLRMDCYTTEPSLQVYTGNHLSSCPGHDGKPLLPLSACCLETQHFPDSTRRAHFPSPVLKAGRPYLSETVYRFIKD